ncbi:hypothetical protein [Amycolatopsis palatopharyngis]|uniref:hypothetical protein n=1 Tax=Amycolatopsis palatopharyngis TaxID=187982 RepID=UPI001FE35EFD|nr:hypothetical protein [Amycolatopsis palatopharyngis]
MSKRQCEQSTGPQHDPDNVHQHRRDRQPVIPRAAARMATEGRGQCRGQCDPQE